MHNLDADSLLIQKKEAQSNNYSPKQKLEIPLIPTYFLLGMIDQFRKMRGKDEFFRKQPFLQSALNATGIWDRVLNEAQEKHEENKRYEALELEGTTLNWR